MRDYATISPRFWIGHTGKRLKASGPEATVVAVYLMTSPHANMLGLYYLPKFYLQHETGLTLEGASKGLQWCIEAGFCQYDSVSEMVWVLEMARHQIGGQLKAGDKRISGIQNQYDKLPDNPFLSGFYDKYSALFAMKSKRDPDGILSIPINSPLEGASEPLRSQEQEQEQEQEEEQDSSPSLRSGADRGADAPSAAEDGKRPKRKRETPRTKIAIDAQPSADDRASATDAGMALETMRHEWRQFRSHHVAKGSLMANWHAAWLTWVGNWTRMGQRQIGDGLPPGIGPPREAKRNPKFAAAERAIERARERDRLEQQSSSNPIEIDSTPLG